MNALTMPMADGWTIARRNTLKIRRSPDMLGAVVMLPIVLVLLFAYVFGSVIDVPGMSYKEFLLPGIFVQAVITGAQVTGYTLTLDLQKGIFDRFRSLPMAPSAVLIGQTISDLLMNLAGLVVMGTMGLIVGWRVHTSPYEAALGFGLLLLFAYAFSWVTATVALALRTPESFNNIATMVSFPLVFISNAFLDSSELPAPLRVFAEWNPVSAFTQAARELFGNTSPALKTSEAWPVQHAVPVSLLWIAVILVVFVPLATRLYKKAVSN
ncbi:ABC transporter permease [Actinomadura madurae]|uniref:ABC transporter permease n=2 Tax=Actinomadura madurae TaxID=1993 RepID=UPI002025B981|nr:ABC transporter permease [Actinomadura madurae]MCP9952087.1 ABC transporter permease [Actinomadura madurae]MCP9981326.1 ABC transporter permease [Actinomadura madurae]MCQ0007168.1 ABC transporter permease [Actinomadura madurae]URM97616.1 ABC transporter permease [Actinomadura madurae]URN08305.1 ABC transporter permease [Actinomadura madurae]